MNYKIGGCDVRFPHQAYGTQLSFMSKVIQALEGGQNALLEAPTGNAERNARAQCCFKSVLISLDLQLNFKISISLLCRFWQNPVVTLCFPCLAAA